MHERVTLCIDDIAKPLELFVMDNDRGPKSDDAMGQALINLMGPGAQTKHVSWVDSTRVDGGCV